MIDIAARLPDSATTWREGGPRWADRATYRFRDLVLYRSGPLVTVVACDSNAGIGDQPADVIRQSSRLTGYSAAKVVLMEVLAAGATPVVLINNLATSLDGTGQAILAGIRECIALSGSNPVITGSDETNVPTTQSGVGITVIAMAEPADLRLGRSRIGDVVAVVGQPKDGITVPYEETDDDIVTPADVRALADHPWIHELLPVGSKGAGYEARQLADGAQLPFRTVASRLDLSQSAGSSTCILVSCARSDLDRLKDATSKSIAVIGVLAV